MSDARSIARNADRSVAGVSASHQMDDIEATWPPESPAGNLCLSNLPDNIIHKIFELARLDYNYVDVDQTKFARMKEVFDRATDDSACSYPLHEPHILSTFQSLAAVNRKLHKVCRPWLWKVCNSLRVFQTAILN